MLEIVICCFIVVVVGYWATLWVMGRNDDVLHGHFLEETRAKPPARAMPTPPPRVPSRPKLPPAKPIASARLPVKPEPANTEELNSLLASLKQELKNAAKL